MTTACTALHIVEKKELATLFVMYPRKNTASNRFYGKQRLLTSYFHYLSTGGVELIFE